MSVKTPCLATLVDEIVSIHGDLSINHDFPLDKIPDDISLEDFSSEQQTSSEETKGENSPEVTIREDKQESTFTSAQADFTSPPSKYCTPTTGVERQGDDRNLSDHNAGRHPEGTSNEPSSVPPNKPEAAADETILEQITLLNRDTGECIPLSKADNILSKCINPLDPHLSTLANDYQSDEEETLSQSNEETASEHGGEPGSSLRTSAFKNGVKKLGKFGHVVIRGVRQVRHRDHSGVASSSADGMPFEVRPLSIQEHEIFQPFKLKTNRKKDVADFENIRMIQELNDCRGAIWCMKWSSCGQLLAAAGQDQLVRVYCSHKAWKTFTHLRSKASGQQISPNSTKERSSSVTNSRNNSLSSSDHQASNHPHSSHSSISGINQGSFRDNFGDDNSLSEEGPLLLFSAYRAHTADVLDISWSKNNFLLSSSRDKTVRLWHITRVECLCTFCHKDFVTTVNFHPRDDRYFLSGSLDGILRLWNIPDKRLTHFNEVMAPSVQNQRTNKSTVENTPPHGLITASAFVENGKFAVIGTYDGRVIFYTIDQLKYFTQIRVGESKGSLMDTSERKKKRNSNKVTGIENVAEKKILVTTNDSRIRLYDLREFSLACKYKGCVNSESQIRASASPDNKYIVCGSENSSFYLWRLREETTTGQRRDRNDQWESVRLLQTRNKNSSQLTSTPSSAPGPSQQQSRNQRAIVTAATFAPNPSYLDDDSKYVIAIAELSGSIKLFSK